MGIIAETREFFLRDKPVNAGVNRDREVGFPTRNKVKRLTLQNDVLVEKYADVGNRFMEGHIPSGKVWEKFLHSIVFKNEEIPNEHIQELTNRITLIEESLAQYDIPDQIQRIGEIELYIQALNTWRQSIDGSLLSAQQGISGIAQSILSINSDIQGISNTISVLSSSVNQLGINLGERPLGFASAFTEIASIKQVLSTLSSWFDTPKANSYSYDGQSNIISLNKQGQTIRVINSSNTFNLVGFSDRFESTLIIVPTAGNVDVSFIVEPNVFIKYKSGGAMPSPLSPSNLHVFKMTCVQRATNIKYLLIDYIQFVL